MLGTRQRGRRCDGKFDHSTGTGFVPAHKGDYCDAIDKRKALVRLLVHEAGGGLAPYAAKYLRFLSRRARTNKHDATDYQCSYSARAFVPFYAQRLSATSAMNAAQGIHKGIEQRHRAHLKGGRLAPRART